MFSLHKFTAKWFKFVEKVFGGNGIGYKTFGKKRKTLLLFMLSARPAVANVRTTMS